MYEKIIRAFEGGNRQIRSDLQSDNIFIGAPAQPSEEPVASGKG
jgi:hypothetical protein